MPTLQPFSTRHQMRRRIYETYMFHKPDLSATANELYLLDPTVCKSAIAKNMNYAIKEGRVRRVKHGTYQVITQEEKSGLATA